MDKGAKPGVDYLLIKKPGVDKHGSQRSNQITIPLGRRVREFKSYEFMGQKLQPSNWDQNF